MRKTVNKITSFLFLSNASEHEDICKLLETKQKIVFFHSFPVSSYDSLLEKPDISFPKLLTVHFKNNIFYTFPTDYNSAAVMSKARDISLYKY